MRPTPWQLRAADVAGRALRSCGLVLRAGGKAAPGLVGALLVAVGLGLAWLPLGLIAAGAFLLLLHWEITGSAPTTKPRPVRYADGRDRPHLRSVS